MRFKRLYYSHNFHIQSLPVFLVNLDKLRQEFLCESYKNIIYMPVFKVNKFNQEAYVKKQCQSIFMLLNYHTTKTALTL